MKQERADIIGLLTADSAVAALVFGRIYACLAPKSATMPYVTVTLASTERPKTHDQRSNASRRKADRRQWTVTAVATSIDDASDLALAIDNALDGKSATGSVVLLFEGVSDLAVFRDDNSDEIIFEIPTEIVSFRRPLD